MMSCALYLPALMGVARPALSGAEGFLMGRKAGRWEPVR